ncbi:MAG TPA: potassium channel family protein [Burkholderiales bacterium]|nr:potassium channel family protein [Burkholderiales bacterium]
MTFDTGQLATARETKTIRQLTSAYRRHRFAILFYSLMLTIGVTPFLRALGFDVMQGFLGLNLIAGALGAAARTGVLMLVLAALFGSARLAGALFGAEVLFVVSEIVWIFVACLATFGSVRYALHRGPVDGERIHAALSAYVLIGIIFGVVYVSYERMWPGSFAVISGPGGFLLPRAVYFSFVTLATLGYGDIVPVSEPARGTAILEAIGGQLYIAVLLARLVALYTAQERRLTETEPVERERRRAT